MTRIATGTRSSPAIRRRSTRRRCASSASNCTSCRIIKSRKNKSNDYGFDPHEQATATYTGMGADINVHDQWAVESMGAIQDRTREHLGTVRQGDRAVSPLLRQEIEKVAAGTKPLMFLDAAHARSIQGPATMDGIGPTRGWETFWMEVDVKRRRGAPWAAPVPRSRTRCRI
jgi:hypothetical protein